MDANAQTEIFFLISSVGFVILWVFMAVFLFYLIRVTKAFHRVLEKVEEDVDKIGDTTREMLEEMKESAVFNFLFKKKKKRLK